MVRALQPEILPFEHWANAVDDFWERCRGRAEGGPITYNRTKMVEEGEVWTKHIIPMNQIPAWIEQYPANDPYVDWCALWVCPNIVIAGYEPLHIIWAVHEVAHQLVYYQHGWIDEPDNGHGPIWQATYLGLLTEFCPGHATLLKEMFTRSGI